VSATGRLRAQGRERLSGAGLTFVGMVQTAVGALVVLGAVLVLAGLWWLARRIRRHGAAGQAIGAAMAAYDEAMHVTAHEAWAEVEAQDRRGSSAMSPTDD